MLALFGSSRYTDWLILYKQGHCGSDMTLMVLQKSFRRSLWLCWPQSCGWVALTQMPWCRWRSC